MSKRWFAFVVVYLSFTGMAAAQNPFDVAVRVDKLATIFT